MFPYAHVRPEQDRLIDAVRSTLRTKQSLVVHAPTGLGKTAATIAPAVEHAIANDLVVLFLTGRHTQHEIALETIKLIRERHNVDLLCADLIGKQHFCLQPMTMRMRNREFVEYCRAMREDHQCDYYENLRQGEELSAQTKSVLARLKGAPPLSAHELKRVSQDAKLCPYEVAALIARRARVIIADYHYLFNPAIREVFLAKIGRKLDECILIIDEAHNLPDRVKELGTSRLSTLLLRRAVSEAEKFAEKELANRLTNAYGALEKMAAFRDERGILVDGDAERYVQRDDLVIDDVEGLVAWCERVGDAVREEQRSSAIGSIAEFLQAWAGEEHGYTRILQRERGPREHQLALLYRCLDPSVITAAVFNECHSAIAMSGTLTPPAMYAQLLGIEVPNLLQLESPFPVENRLNIIIPKTSTKFSQRSEAMWSEIVGILRKVVLAVPGNVAVFFPSYWILERIAKELDAGLPKTVMAEQRGMSKEEKHAFLQRFRGYRVQGAVLLGVITGNYGEGIDLPGDELRGVVVVGLPLAKPDLETQALIKYYDAKFRRGWEYGYTIPAFNKTLQSAGRCIRSATDKGVVVFLDERYEWPRYAKLFPKEWRMKSTLLFEKIIKEFFA